VNTFLSSKSQDITRLYDTCTLFFNCNHGMASLTYTQSYVVRFLCDTFWVLSIFQFICVLDYKFFSVFIHALNTAHRVVFQNIFLIIFVSSSDYMTQNQCCCHQEDAFLNVHRMPRCRL